MAAPKNQIEQVDSLKPSSNGQWLPPAFNDLTPLRVGWAGVGFQGQGCSSIQVKCWEMLGNQRPVSRRTETSIQFLQTVVYCVCVEETVRPVGFLMTTNPQVVMISSNQDTDHGQNGLRSNDTCAAFIFVDRTESVCL
ncbi:hypothetical protein AVEN_222485-1 [Araneus ventricosus]|uniref:Uncharacterized protein n=1 Tax=Araneus ventricosus TaxID=182803 RepID=A0A4Y2PYA7_ARAVE|nr:hypothetical protein AVEN_222485-1 [Araneus ventricosus]